MRHQNQITMTTKEILTANRDSVISSIKYIFKIWKNEDLKIKMIGFLSYAEANSNPEELMLSKRIKTDLKMLVARYANDLKKQENLLKYGTETPKLEDIIAYGSMQTNLVYDNQSKNWIKY